MDNTLYRIRINVRAGRGGNGIVSFNHSPEKYKGGPDGGNGGAGGNVHIEADEEYHTFEHLHGIGEFKAPDGDSGGENKKQGKKGGDLKIHVPPGTLVLDKNGETLADLRENGESICVAEGGKGGKGNFNFTTPTNRAPRISTEGKPGAHRELILELNPIIDIVVIGPANTGKSSLIGKITNNKPKVESYPYSTREPHLWTDVHDFSRITFLDTPPLNEKTEEGILTLSERAGIILFVLSVEDGEGKNLNILDKFYSDFDREGRKIFIILNKIDLGGEIHTDSFPQDVIKISTEEEDNIEKLKKKIYSIISGE